MPDTRTIRPSDPKTLSLWRKERDLLYANLTLLGFHSLAHKHLNCGNSYWAWHCWECMQNTELVQSCDIRLCPRCAIRRAQRFILTHQTVLTAMTQPKLLTLTFQSPQSLSKPLVKLYFKHFATLRRQKLWKDAVKGGLASLEFTYTDSGWHPHIHALIDSSYIPQRLLSQTWKRITKGAYIVYIQSCDRSAGVYEVAKYISKGPRFWAQKLLVYQYLQTTKKARFFTTFGSFHGSADPLEKQTSFSAPPGWNGLEPDLPPWLPQLSRCPKCGSEAITGPHFLHHHHIDPPNVQIPF